jgi:hypothetical protein
MHACV